MTFTFKAFASVSVIILARPTLFLSVFFVFGNIFLGLLSPYAWNTSSPYQQNRDFDFFKSRKDPLGVAYRIIQSKTAIGSGGLFGEKGGARHSNPFKVFTCSRVRLYIISYRRRIRVCNLCFGFIIDRFL